MFGVDALTKEHCCVIVELAWLFGGQEAYAAVLCNACLHIGMPTEIVGKALCHIFALRNQVDVRRSMFPNLVVEQGIVGATQYDGIYVRVLRQQLPDVFLHKEIGSVAIVFTVLDEGNPHGAGLSCNTNVWIKFAYFNVVGLRADSARGGKDADMARLSNVADTLGSRANDTQHTPTGVDGWQVALLDSAQGLGRCSVAGQHNQRATHVE